MSAKHLAARSRAAESGTKHDFPAGTENLQSGTGRSFPSGTGSFQSGAGRSFPSGTGNRHRSGTGRTFLSGAGNRHRSGTRRTFLSGAGRSLLSGALVGLGFVAFIDETVFHQLLHWHHFYDKSTTELGLVSDGLFHAFSWVATVGGLYLLADLRRLGVWHQRPWWGGMLLGGGAFQLYDGTIQHKILRIHQIRYVDNVAIYDLVWNILAVGMVLAGIWLIRGGMRKEKASEDGTNEREWR